jgi:hypothetical protein
MNMTKQDLTTAMAAALWLHNNSPDSSSTQAAADAKVTSIFLPSIQKTLTQVTFFEDPVTCVNGMTGIIDGTFILTFDASTNKQDWLTDFFFFKKVMPYAGHESSPVRMHGGYAKGWMAVRDQVHALFLESEMKKVLVCGYSMGGGLAPIGALDLQYTYELEQDAIKCIAADGPRVMNKAGMDSYNRRVPNTIRSKYGNDVATKVPPPIFGFWHVAKQYHAGSKEHWWQMSVKDHMNYDKLIAEINKLPEGLIAPSLLYWHR